MCLLKQFKLLADYNQLMNSRLYDATALLPDKKINENKGAFFKSLLGTLNHIMVGDIIWLKRFSNVPSNQQSLRYFSSLQKPTSLDAILFDNFNELRQEREKMDNLIIQWINSLSDKDFEAKVEYRNMKGLSFRKEYSSLIHHLFLHQVHHRGQATTLLSQFGVEFGDTDLIEMIK